QARSIVRDRAQLCQRESIQLNELTQLFSTQTSPFFCGMRHPVPYVAQQLLCAAQYVFPQESDWMPSCVEQLHRDGHAYLSLRFSQNVGLDVVSQANQEDDDEIDVLGIQQITFRGNTSALLIDTRGTSWIWEETNTFAEYTDAIAVTRIEGTTGKLIGRRQPEILLDEQAVDYELVTWSPSQATTIRTVNQDSIFAFSGDGNRLAIGSVEWTVALWDFKQQQFIEIQGDVNIPSYQKGPAAIAVDSKGETVFFSMQDSAKIDKWVVGQSLEGFNNDNDREITVMLCSQDGSLLVSGTDDGKVTIWETKTNARMKVLKGHQKKITGIAISRDKTLIVTASFDGTIRVWDWQGIYPHIVDVQSILEGEDSSKEDGSLSSPTSCQIAHVSIATQISAIDVSPNGSRIAAGDKEGNVFVWDLILPNP
ncbi:MAG: hypothetical protein D6704_02650, partial [Nitrospirae bacterium]